MANWAYVQSGEIVALYHSLPRNWRSYSNFFALEKDHEYLKNIGWFKVVKKYPEYNPTSEKLVDPYHWFENGVVYESMRVVSTVTEPGPGPDEIAMQWEEIRHERDYRIKEIDWRYQRYYREQRLGLPTTDTLLSLDQYVQALCDVTKQEDPFSINWPTL